MNIPATRPNESLSFGDIVTMITPRLKIEWKWRSLSHRLGDRRREKKWNYHLTMDRQQRKEEIQFLQLSCSLFFYRAHRSLSRRRDCEYKMKSHIMRGGRQKKRKKNEKSQIFALSYVCCLFDEKNLVQQLKKVKKNVGCREADRLRITVCPSASLQSTRWALSYFSLLAATAAVVGKKLKLKLFSIDDSFLFRQSCEFDLSWEISPQWESFNFSQTVAAQRRQLNLTSEKMSWLNNSVGSSVHSRFSSADFWVANSDVVTRLHVLMLNSSLLSIAWFTREEWRSKSSEEAAKFSH